MATLRLNMQNDWTVAEFRSVLQHLDSAYDRAQHWERLGELFDGQSFEQRLYRFPFTRRSQPFYYDLDELLIGDRSIRQEDRGQPLTIKQIQIASPGVVDVLGQLNPLNSIVQLILGLRQQNTDKIENTRRHEREMIDKRIEMAKAQLQVLAVIFEKFDLLKKKERDQLFVRAIENTQLSIIDELQERVSPLASSKKLSSVEMVDAG